MSHAREIHPWQTLTFHDADAMGDWLTAIGFVEHASYRDDSDPAVVVHSEWVWPEGAGLMAGTERPDAVGSTAPGHAACYLVAQDPRAIFEAAVAAGATVVEPLTEKDYGGIGGTVQDPEGNLWSFGGYQPR